MHPVDIDVHEDGSATVTIQVPKPPAELLDRTHAALVEGKTTLALADRTIVDLYLRGAGIALREAREGNARTDDDLALERLKRIRELEIWQRARPHCGAQAKGRIRDLSVRKEKKAEAVTESQEQKTGS